MHRILRSHIYYKRHEDAANYSILNNLGNTYRILYDITGDKSF